MRNTKIIFCLLVLQTISITNTFSQQYSIRTNLFNLAAKGPSFAFGKYINENTEILLTFSNGNFAPFINEDSYKYSTGHVEFRWENGYFLWGKPYIGTYIRYIHKRIITEGFTGPYGLFSKESRNFIGDGISIGMTSGTEWSISKNWFVDLNNMIGAGKYIFQKDYAGHEKINVFLDVRIALQIGYKF